MRPPTVPVHHERRGAGAPLVLVHGPGSTWRIGDPVLPGPAAHREVVAVDLPGSGRTPPLAGEVSIATRADAAVLAQVSPRPWALPPQLVLRELRAWAAAPSCDAPLDALVHGPGQEGAPVG